MYNVMNWHWSKIKDLFQPPWLLIFTKKNARGFGKAIRIVNLFSFYCKKVRMLDESSGKTIFAFHFEIFFKKSFNFLQDV